MAIITDSLGRRWNSALHPRDRKGRFIHTFRLVKLFDAAGSSKPWGVGRVDKINDEGHIDITVTKTRDGQKTKPGQKVTLSSDKLESVNERADLRKARTEATGDPNDPSYSPNANVTEARKRGLAKQNERQQGKAGAGPRAFGMATGFSRADGEAAERVLADPDSERDPKARLLAGLWLDHERNAGQISDQDFIESLDELGVDPNITDSSPDGRTGLKPLVDEYNATNPERRAAVPAASWVEWENPDGSRTGHTADVIQGNKGKAYVKANVHDIVQNEDGTWERQDKEPVAAIQSEISEPDGERPDFPSPDEISEALEGKFDGNPDRANANIGNKRFSFEKTEDDDIYDVTVRDYNGTEEYSGEHDTSDTRSLAADLYESVTGEEYTGDVGGEDDDILADIPDVDEETGEPLIPEEAPDTNAKPEEGPPKDSDEQIADLTPDDASADADSPVQDERLEEESQAQEEAQRAREDEIAGRIGELDDEQLKSEYESSDDPVERQVMESEAENRGISLEQAEEDTDSDIPDNANWPDEQELEEPKVQDWPAEGEEWPEPRAEIPPEEDEGADRDPWEVIDSVTPQDAPGDFRDGWQIGKGENEEDTYFRSPDGNEYPFDSYERGADEDGSTADKRSSEEIVADFEAARSRDNEGREQPPTPDEPTDSQNQITEALEKSVIDGDPVPLRDGWSLQVESSGEDGNDEAASFITPEGHVYPFDHTEVYEDPDNGKSLDRRPDADMERDFQRIQEAHAANERRRQQKEAAPEAAAPTAAASKIGEVRGLDNTADRQAWIEAQDDETLKRTLADLATNGDGSTNDLVAAAQIEGALKRRERGEAQQRVPGPADKPESPQDLLETDPDAPTPQSKPESPADLQPADEDGPIEPDPEGEARDLDDEMKARLDSKRADIDAEYPDEDLARFIDEHEAELERDDLDDESRAAMEEDLEAAKQVRDERSQQEGERRLQDQKDADRSQQEADERAESTTELEEWKIQQIKGQDDYTLQQRLRNLETDGYGEGEEADFIRTELANRKTARNRSAWLRNAQEYGIVTKSDEEVDAEISEGFAGQNIEPTDELRQKYREREVALGRLDQLNSPAGEEAWRENWREEYKKFFRGDPIQRTEDESFEEAKKNARGKYRDTSSAYNAELISEIQKQANIQTPKEGDDDGRSDGGTDSGLPDPDGVPGGPAGGAQATPEESSDGSSDLRSDRRRVHLAGKDVEVDEESRLTSAWDADESRRLEREGFSNPDLYELDSANAADFRRAVEASKAQNAYGAAVPTYTDEEYAKMRLFVTADGKTGIALRGDEMLAAFSRKDAADKRPVPSMHAKMVAQGARRASSFDNHQPGIHAASGFRVVARRKWNDSEAPAGWNKGVFEKWNKGEPDTVYYAYDPDAIGKPYHKDDGVAVETPEDAQSLVDRFLKGDRDFLNPPGRTAEDAGVDPVDISSPLQARRARLEAASRGEIIDDVMFNPSVETGFSAELHKVTFEDGTTALLKVDTSDRAIDNNLAYEQFVEALGGKSQASIPFFYDGNLAMISDIVEGRHFKEQDIIDETDEWKDLLDKPEAKAIAAADWISLESDRHVGNFLVHPDGYPVAIDSDEAAFKWQGSRFSMFEDATFETDPSTLQAALDSVRDWFESEGMEDRWAFANERAHDYRELHSRSQGNPPDETLIYPELVDEDSLTDAELEEAAARNGIMYGHALKRRREEADTDMPSTDQGRAGRNEIYDQALENLAEYEANKHEFKPIDGSNRKVYRREDGAIVTETWNVRENKTRQTIVHPDGRIENKTLDPSSIDWKSAAEGFDIPSSSAGDVPDIVQREDRRPEWIMRDKPGVPFKEARIDPVTPVPSGVERREMGNGWARETGNGQDMLIAPDGKAYDLTQTYLKGDTPDIVAKRVRRQYYLEMMEPPDVGDAPPGTDQILAVAERINVSNLNDLDFPRTEAVQLPDENFPPNEEQQAGNDAINADKHIIMNAKAGVGKTTFLVGAAKRIKLAFPKKRILYNVFNRSVRAEAEERMPDNVEVRTYHSIPMRWAPKWMTARIGKDGTGMTRLGEISEHLKMRDIGDDTKSTVARKALRAVDTYAFSADDEISLDHFGESIKDYSDEEKKEILKYANAVWDDWNSPNGKLKMTYDAARKRWALTRPNFTETRDKSGIDPIDILFVDEAQDTPPVMAKIYADQKEFGVQLVVVGDPDQAINGFTGAINFLDDIAPEMDTHLPLTKSYRYGPAVADIANRFLQFKQSIGRVIGAGPKSEIVRGMEDPDAILTRSNGGMIAEVIEQMEMGKKVGAPEGTKKDLTNLIRSARALRTGFPMRQPHEDFAQYDTWQEFAEDAQSGDNPVAAKNYRLFTAFDFDTLKGFVDNLIEPGSSDPENGVMAKMQKRDAPNGIVLDFEWGSKFDAWNYRDILEDIGFENGPSGELYKRKGKWGPAGTPKTKKVWYAPGTPEEREAKFAEAQRRINALAGVEPDVIVSTAHKAKGLEWDSVKLGSDFKGPTVGPDGELEMPEEQEINLAYVAVTRAAKRLDPGSLDWVYEYTDDNGGTPGDEPDHNDFDKRIERREEQLDDKKRADVHKPEQTAPSVPDNPDADVQEPVDDDSIEQVPAPRGLPEGSSPTVDILPPKDSDGHDLYPLNDGYHYAFNEDDTDTTLGVDVFDPNGRRVASVQIDEDMTSNDMHRSLNDLISNNFEGPEPEAAEPDIEVKEVEEVPEQEQSFDDRYPELTGNEDPADVARKADELSALAKQIGPTDPEFINVMTKALAYADAARGGALPARGQVLAAKADNFPEGLSPRAQSDDGGYRVADQVDHTGRHDMDYISGQIPTNEDGYIDRDRLEQLKVWDLGDGAAGYFAHVKTTPGGDMEISIFRNNGQKDPIVVDRFTMSPDAHTGKYATQATMDAVERHKASRRKVGPSAADKESGDRVIDAFRRQDNSGLTKDELEWKVQLEYTFRGGDGEVDFELFERLMAERKNPTLTNMLKYMEDVDGPFRFWEKGEEAGYKMRIGQHAWQQFDDTEKGRAHARGEGPPDIRHGRIVDMPTHSQPNITIWRHDENGEPMWVPSKKDPDILVPHLSRYHMNRVNQFYGLHYDGTPMTADEAAGKMMGDGGPSPADFGSGVENTAKFRDEGIDLFEYNDTRQFEFHEVYVGVPLTHAERMDLAARETNGFTDLRDGDNFTFDEDQKIVYDAETDQFVFFHNDRYHGFEDASEFQSGDRAYLADRISGLGNGGGLNRTPDTGFTEVPESHWRKKHVEAGPWGDMRRREIKSVFAYNGNEVVNRSEKVNEYQGMLREGFLQETNRAFDNLGDELGNHKVTVDIPPDNADPHFLIGPDGSTTLAYIVPFLPDQINVNPRAIYGSFGHDNFMPAAQRDKNLEYVMTHELGHVHDSLNTNMNGSNPLTGITPTADAIAFHRQWFASLSGYGQSSPHEGYAEARAQWIMGGPGSSEVADAYAEKYSWPVPVQFAAPTPEGETPAPTDVPTGPVV